MKSGLAYSVLKARETGAVPLVTRTPMAVEIGRRD
jgi:hypothetical protein